MRPRRWAPGKNGPALRDAPRAVGFNEAPALGAGEGCGSEGSREDDDGSFNEAPALGAGEGCSVA